jgi:hypothetical protein
MGPCTGKQTSITQASWWGDEGVVLPEEAGAGLLQSLIKLLVLQMGGWKLGDTSYSPILPSQALEYLWAHRSKGTVTTGTYLSTSY